MKHERPQPEAGGAVNDPWHDHSTAPSPPPQDPEAAELPEGVTTLPEALAELAAILPGLRNALNRPPGPPVDRMTLRLDELAAALGVSRRAIERERSAGRFPRPDLTIGKMPLWRVETVRAYLERGGRS